MVTAGVYLIARSAALYVLVPDAQQAVAWVGALTAIFAATIAVGQFDIKKVLAYSTISQLGFMVAAVGAGAFAAGMFHLVTHAFFKALLFLSSGSVIQGMEAGHHHAETHGKKKQHGAAHFDPQDMRNMGGLRSRMKTTFWVYLVGAVALAGIPPLAGFWSKDEILAEQSVLNPSIYWILTLAAFFTAFYTGRQILMVFFGESRTAAADHAQENPPLMTVPLMVLAFLSFFGGLLNLPGVHTFTHWLEHAIEEIHAGEFNLLVAVTSTALALVGIFLAWQLYGKRYQQLQKIPAAKRPEDPLVPILGPIFNGMKNKWWVDELYAALILNPYIALSQFLADVIDWRFWHDWFHDSVIARGFNGLTRLLAVPIDLGIIDGFANALAGGTTRAASVLRRVQTGFVRNYALSVFLGVVIILGYLILR
jgi:NADH-quinone oxidoreductase subunit L